MEVRFPAAVGEKVTAMLQLAPNASVPPQLLLLLKSPEFPPLMPKLDMLSAAEPEFVRVTVWGVLEEPTF